MKFDLKLAQYVDWEVTNVMPIKKSWGYRVILKYMDDSQRVQQKSGFTTEKEANEARNRTIGELYAGTYIVYANVKMREFLIFWLEEDIRNRVGSMETYDAYRNIIYRHIIPEWGGRKVCDIQCEDVYHLCEEKAKTSESITRLMKTVLNTAFGYAVDKKIISENPATSVKLPKGMKKNLYHTRNIDSQKTLTTEQILKLLEASRETPIHMQILLNVLMGLRRREINGVKYSDIDYVRRTLHVERQLGRAMNTKKEDLAPKTYTKQEVRLKTESSCRELPIPDYVFEAILEERKIYEKNRSRRGSKFQDNDYICCSNYGRPRSKEYHWKYYKQLLKDTGLPDIRWHDLRATFCTMLLKNDFNPKVVSKLMGHAKEIITIDVYGDNREIISDCVTELQPFIDEVAPVTRTEAERNLSDIVIPLEDYLSA